MTCLAESHLAGLAMLPPSDPERRAADAHAATCPRCKQALLDAERVLSPLTAWPSERDVAPDVARARGGLTAALAEDAQRVLREGWVALAGAAIVLLIALSMFRVANAGVAPLLECVAALVVAAFAALHARTTSSAKVSVAIVLAASTSMVALELGGGPADGLAADHGIVCASVLSAAGILPALVASFFALRTLEPGQAWRIAARAGAAGLIGQAALALVCSSHGVFHLLVFHLSGLVAVVLLGSILPSLFALARPPSE